MKPTSKIGRLVRFSILTVKSGMAQARSLRFAGSPAFTKWNFIRVLAVVALMSVSGVTYFNLASEGVADVPTTVQNVGVTSSDDSARYLRRLSNDDEWRFGPPYIEDFSADAMPRSPASRGIEYVLDDELWVPPYYEAFDDFKTNEAASPSASNVWQCYPEDEGFRVGGLGVGSKFC